MKPTFRKRRAKPTWLSPAPSGEAVIASSEEAQIGGSTGVVYVFGAAEKNDETFATPRQMLAGYQSGTRVRWPVAVSPTSSEVTSGHVPLPSGAKSALVITNSAPLGFDVAAATGCRSTRLGFELKAIPAPVCVIWTDIARQ